MIGIYKYIETILFNSLNIVEIIDGNKEIKCVYSVASREIVI